MKAIMQVMSSEWGGTLHSGWRPAIAGTLNQTGLSDEASSEFPSLRSAMEFLPMVRAEAPESIRIIAAISGRVLYEENLEEDTPSH